MIILWVNIRVWLPSSWNSVFGTMWLRFSSWPQFRPRDSPTAWCRCAFFCILPQCYVPSNMKKTKIDNFVCLLEFECAKRQKAHSRAIPVGRGPTILLGLDLYTLATPWHWHSCWESCRVIDSLAPGIFERNFRHVIFKQILAIDGWDISCETALILMSLDFTDDQSTWVQVMAWCRQATSHYLSQCWPRSLSPYGVTRPQWVNRTRTRTRQWNILLTLHSTAPTKSCTLSRQCGCQSGNVWQMRSHAYKNVKSLIYDTP